MIIVLEREGKPLSPNEIAELVELSERAIRHALKILIKYGEVKKSDERPVKYSIK